MQGAKNFLILIKSLIQAWKNKIPVASWAILTLYTFLDREEFSYSLIIYSLLYKISIFKLIESELCILNGWRLDLILDYLSIVSQKVCSPFVWGNRVPILLSLNRFIKMHDWTSLSLLVTCDVLLRYEIQENLIVQFVVMLFCVRVEEVLIELPEFLIWHLKEVLHIKSCIPVFIFADQFFIKGKKLE